MYATVPAGVSPGRGRSASRPKGTAWHLEEAAFQRRMAAKAKAAARAVSAGAPGGGRGGGTAPPQAERSEADSSDEISIPREAPGGGPSPARQQGPQASKVSVSLSDSSDELSIPKAEPQQAAPKPPSGPPPAHLLPPQKPWKTASSSDDSQSSPASPPREGAAQSPLPGAEGQNVAAPNDEPPQREQAMGKPALRSPCRPPGGKPEARSPGKAVAARRNSWDIPINEHTGAEPVSWEEYWKWHWDKDNNRWHARGKRIGRPGGGPDTTPGLHTRSNAKRRERREASQLRRAQQAVEDPGGEKARKKARMEKRLTGKLLGELRQAWLQRRRQQGAREVPPKREEAQAKARLRMHEDKEYFTEEGRRARMAKLEARQQEADEKVEARQKEADGGGDLLDFYSQENRAARREQWSRKRAAEADEERREQERRDRIRAGKRAGGKAGDGGGGESIWRRRCIAAERELAVARDGGGGDSIWRRRCIAAEQELAVARKFFGMAWQAEQDERAAEAKQPPWRQRDEEGRAARRSSWWSHYHE